LPSSLQLELINVEYVIYFFRMCSVVGGKLYAGIWLFLVFHSSLETMAASLRGKMWLIASYLLLLRLGA
jgi:hypothetical protein